jgi:ketosteroid isomerase-like protein
MNNDRANNNTHAVDAFFKAITANDSATMLALMAPEVEWVVPKTAAPPYGGRHRGARKIVDMMLLSVKATFLPGTVIHRVLMQMSDEQRVIAETNMTAKQASGREYNNFYVFIFEFEDGLITEIREHVDTAYAVQFFGGGS